MNDTSILPQKLLVAASLSNMREDYINNGVYMRRVQILVVGSDSDHCTELANKLAYEVGEEVALKGAVMVTGGSWRGHGSREQGS